MIPEKFECAGFVINVKIVDKLHNNEYGLYCDATNTISIAKTVDVADIGKVELTEQQMLNTFMHELVHVWQFYFNNTYDEAQAQVFANFMCEYIKTKENQLPF
jgi:hypothetical protein